LLVLEKEMIEVSSVNDKDWLDVEKISAAKIPVYTAPSFDREDQESAMSTSQLKQAH